LSRANSDRNAGTTRLSQCQATLKPTPPVIPNRDPLTEPGGWHSDPPMRTRGFDAPGQSYASPIPIHSNEIRRRGIDAQGVLDVAQSGTKWHVFARFLCHFTRVSVDGLCTPHADRSADLLVPVLT